MKGLIIYAGNVFYYFTNFSNFKSDTILIAEVDQLYISNISRFIITKLPFGTVF